MRRFATQQMSNINSHLRSLHHGGPLKSHFGASISQTNDTLETASDHPPGETDAPGMGGFVATHGEAASAPSFTNEFGQFSHGRVALWSGGSIDIGTSELSGGDDEMDHVSLAQSADIDYRLTKNLVAGFAVGVNRTHTDVSDNGTKVDGSGASLSGYASCQALSDFYLDAIAGFGGISLDNTRYVTSTGDYDYGTRAGCQTFASLQATYEKDLHGVTVAPYLKAQASRSWLDSYSETGGGSYNLKYGDETVDSLTGSIGVRVETAFATAQGTIKLYVSFEYSHEFADASDLALSYLSTSTIYSLTTDEDAKDTGTVEFGAQLMTIDQVTRLSLEYGMTFDQDGISNQPIRLRLSHDF